MENPFGSISKIDQEFIEDDKIRYVCEYNSSPMIIDSKEIIFLDSNSLISKKPCDMEVYPVGSSNDVSGNYCHTIQEFKYNNLYIYSNRSIHGYQLKQLIFLTAKNGKTYCVEDTICTNEKAKIEFLNRNQLEGRFLFDELNFDSAYILNNDGKILYAQNRIDGKVIDNFAILSDDQIIESEFANQFRQNIIIKGLLGLEKTEVNRKSIDEIHDYILFGCQMGGYQNIIITSKDNTIRAFEFKITMKSRDIFEYNTSELLLFDIGNATNYLSSNLNIDYTKKLIRDKN